MLAFSSIFKPFSFYLRIFLFRENASSTFLTCLKHPSVELVSSVRGFGNQLLGLIEQGLQVEAQPILLFILPCLHTNLKVIDLLPLLLSHFFLVFPSRNKLTDGFED